MAAKRKTPTGRPRGRPRKYPKAEDKTESKAGHTAEPEAEAQKEGEKKLIVKLNMNAKMKTDPPSSSAPAPAPPIYPPDHPRHDVNWDSDFGSDSSLPDWLVVVEKPEKPEFNPYTQLEGNSYTGPFLGFKTTYNEAGHGTLKVPSNTVNAHQEGFVNNRNNTPPEWITTETLPTYHYAHSFGPSADTGNTIKTEDDSEATISAKSTPGYDDRKKSIGDGTVEMERKREATVSTDQMSENVQVDNNSGVGSTKMECKSEATDSVEEKPENGHGNDSGDGVVLTANYWQIQNAAHTGYYDWLDPAFRDQIPCGFCVETFDAEHLKQRHELVYHTGSYYQCQSCEVACLDGLIMYNHARRDHGYIINHQGNPLQRVQRVQHDPEVQQFQATRFLNAERVEEAVRKEEIAYHANVHPR
ncbi:hypothetical protein BKA81DRAFT_403172 [Phyllosticta paracitricarpa]|uniref:C2H2-type domain-containing protein n=2 Tax=Phyllosticta TaxID=121621 RepID=A0ABR1MQP6_9PEZI